VPRGIAVGALAAAAWLRPPFPLVRAVARALPDVAFHVPTEQPLIALSFDDGPHPATTGPIIETLERHRARATFFAVGERAARHPQLLEAVVGQGSELGNHTWRVERSASLPPDELARSIDRTQEVLGRFQAPRLMRPGSGWVNRRVLAAANERDLRVVLGSIYPQDPLLRWTPYIVQFVLARARPGAIVILHEGTVQRARVVDALELILPRLRGRGLRVTTVSELLASAGEAPAPDAPTAAPASSRETG
jgi:peptidoglycan-N-acetylglucosamine deacetylase